MSVYKVPQDVEAEDKLVGPFTFRQFIFLIVAAISLFLTVQFFKISPFLSLVTLPPLIIFGILGVYRRPDQPVEIYLLAVLRFYLKPHKRIWDQEGIFETVKITAPKKEVHQFTDGLTQNEVRNRLNALAGVMDSRGWSVKNSGITSPIGMGPLQESDRLIMPTQPNEPTDLHAADDMLDFYNNPVARNFGSQVQDSTAHIREAAVASMHPSTTVQPQDSNNKDDDVAFNPYPSSMRQHVIQPLSSGSKNMNRNQTKTAPPTKPAPNQNNREQKDTSAMTPGPSDAILRLANNSDLRVSTIAKEAARIESLEDDQTISLH